MEITNPEKEKQASGRPQIVKPRNWLRTSIPIALAIFIGFGGLLTVYTFARSLAVLALSITLAESLAPLAAWLCKRMRRVFAVSLIYLSLFGAIGVAGFFVVPQMIAEGNAIAARTPELLETAGSHLRHWMKALPDSMTPDAGGIVSSLMSQLASLPVGLFRAGLTILLMVFLSFYWLLALPAIDRFVQSLFPKQRRARVAAIREKVGSAMGGYVRGAALNALATGTLAGTALAIAGVDYAFALGALTAAGEFFPYIGPIIAAIPGVLTGLLQSPSMALWTALIYLGVEQIEGHLLTPNIMRSQTDIPQSLIIFALFAGGVVGGLLGALVAIPIAGACKILIEEVAAPVMREWMHEASARTGAHD